MSSIFTKCKQAADNGFGGLLFKWEFHAFAICNHSRKCNKNDGLGRRRSIVEAMWPNITEEFADVCIRIFNACGEYNLDLATAIENKMEKNKARGYKHGGRRI